MLPFPEHFLEYPLEVVYGLQKKTELTAFILSCHIFDKILLINKFHQTIFS